MAYAAVTSLMGTLHLHFLQSQPRIPFEDKQKMVSLHENLGFLQQILEESDDAAPEMKGLEAQMRDVLFKAETRIEMELRTIYLQSSSTSATARLHRIFNQSVKQTDYLKKKLTRIKNAKGSSLLGRMRRTGLLLGSTSDPERQNIRMSKISRNGSKSDSRMVGCNKEFMMVLDQLTPQSGNQRQVVSIVGMGGIGKTTLARKVYEDPSITSHFDKRALVTVSQDYNVEQMLRCLISCVFEASGSDEQSNNQEGKLAESLYKLLKGRRYLIVIDDIWSTTAWESVQMCFPDDNNGSRILLTSRLKEVAEYASSGNSPLNMCLLDLVESWNLYCKVFGKNEFPFEYEKIGRDIVKKCEGLPLAIIVVASLLKKTEERVEKWMDFAKSVSRSVNGDSNEACSRILYLSYNQLPHHLKACFLYFGVFPEDYEIPVNKLVRLWTAEGFLRAVKHQCPEEAAMECLQDLVNRSLVIVSKQRYSGEIKTIRIHDLLRDLCLREGRRENLLNVIVYEEEPYSSVFKRISQYLLNVIGYEEHHSYVFKRIQQHLLNVIAYECRWISIATVNDPITSKCFDKLHSLHLTFDHSYFSVVKSSQVHFKLLRVVDMKLKAYLGGSNVLDDLANLVHLRYLALSVGNCPRRPFRVKLFEHWNMQSFIVHGGDVVLDSYEASGIWKMPLIRNFCVDKICSLETSSVVYRHLENISWLDPKFCTEDLFTRIPNLKKLGILHHLTENSDYFYSFVHLGQLEKLSIRDWHNLEGIPCRGIQWATSFLPNLKKLNFIGTGVPWSDMSIIGMLPKLEVLKLKYTCQGQKWEPSEGGFRRLKRLVIKSTNLKYWNAVGDHFPVLECLEISECYSLKEIPIGFADIITLALIHLNKCSDSLLASAKLIQDEQYNNYGTAILVRSENITIESENNSEEECDEEEGSD